MITLNEYLPNETATYFNYYIKFPDVLNLGSDEKETQLITGLLNGRIKVTEDNLQIVVKLKNECYRKIQEIESFTEKAKIHLNEITNLNAQNFLKKWN